MLYIEMYKIKFFWNIINSCNYFLTVSIIKVIKFKEKIENVVNKYLWKKLKSLSQLQILIYIESLTNFINSKLYFNILNILNDLILSLIIQDISESKL